jgi:hypothetical protein
MASEKERREPPSWTATLCIGGILPPLRLGIAESLDDFRYKTLHGVRMPPPQIKIGWKDAA